MNHYIQVLFQIHHSQCVKTKQTKKELESLDFGQI